MSITQRKSFSLAACVAAVTCSVAAQADSARRYATVEEVLVTGHKNQPNFEASALTEKLLKTAGTMGDPIQAIFSLPGVVQVDEEDAEPAVRGSSPNANLFLIDGLPVEFLFHPFGNSIINENLIHDFGLKAAGFGARYGKATGAVFDVTLRDPKNQPLQTIVDLGLLRAGAMVEGGVTENQSFYFSYREGLIQLFLEEEDEEEDIRITDMPRATDYQGKYLWQLDGDRSLTLQVTGARDRASANFGRRSEEVLLDPGLEGNAVIDTEFHSQGLTWRGRDTTVVAGHIVQQSEEKVGNGEYLDLTENIWILKGEQGWQLQNHYLSIGANLERRDYDYDLNLRLARCSDFSPDCEFDRRDPITEKRTQDVNTYEAFVEDQWAVTGNVLLTAGVHFTRDDYLRESHADPRFSARWDLADNWTLTGSVGRYHQAPQEEEMFPVIGNPNLTSLSSNHYVLGLNHVFDDDGRWLDSSWSWNAELYYKDIDDLVVDTDNDAEPFLNRGTGKAYGLELMVNKDLTDRWYGWMSLGLSKTERTNEITGQSTPFSYDTPVLVNLVINYQWTEKWNAGLRWTYRSGTLYTPIIGNTENPQFPGFYIPVYGEFNSERVEPFHRLDLRLERPFDSFAQGSFYVDFINLYNRNNTSGIDYEPVVDSADFKLTKTEGIGLFPAIGVKLVF